MQALGLIETKGLLATIEAADAMVKSANVNILEKVYVGGGLVSVTITGDVGAVKSAIDAGISAVNRLGENFLISSHVIARPHYDLESIIETTPAVEKVEKAIEKAIEEEIIEDEACEATLEVMEDITEETLNTSLENSNEEDINKEIQIENIEIEVELDREKLNKLVKEEGIEKSLQLLRDLKVSRIRKLAKEFKDFDLTSKTISKLDKESLIKKFKEYYKNK
ncbi:microcompartment protein CcmL/EutN [Clostridium moniliforme]|uniref:Microcompartment protein CcmL/EutN n=1 Tax=Clostridium moniliforme TaxID=39489 RepID=A0ABS4F344_9CLOT|nr:BMC domain-containing protein [Clostridium moniliforme]MBP1890507.1 microcompartment protein CcmL/EutN [Clostridium moniliforme]